MSSLGGRANSSAGPDSTGGGLRASGKLPGPVESPSRSPSRHPDPSSDEPLGGRLRKMSLGQYDNDAGAQLSFSKCAWATAGVELGPGLAPFPSSGDTNETVITAYPSDLHVIGGRMLNSKEPVCSTPAFPVSPETPFVKTPPYHPAFSLPEASLSSPAGVPRVLRDPRGCSEVPSHAAGMSESPLAPKGPMLQADVAGTPTFPQAFAASCSISGNGLGQHQESLPPAERQWLESSPKSTLALWGSGRPSGSPLGASELLGPGTDAPGPPCFPASDLQASLHSRELSLAEPPVTLSAPGSQAFLGVSAAAPVGGGLVPGEDPGALLPGTHGAAPAPSGALTMPAAANNGFLSHNFLTVGHGHSGRHSPGLQGQGGSLPGQPPLPEKKRASEGDRSLGSVSPSSSGFSSPHSGSTISIPFPSALPDFSRPAEAASPLPDSPSDKLVSVKFVQDTSKFWYKPDISRDQAIAMLKDKEPGSFVVRDSHSFRGAYGLAMKVATPPPSVLQLNKKGDLSNELVRHFLIECTPKGVRLKGCSNEPYFGSLTALVCQHSITPLALPCKLLIPEKDPLEETAEPSPHTAANSAAELLKQGAACNVWYLNSVEMESLTGHQAVQKALSLTLLQEPPPLSTVVHFKVSAQGITLTDNQRKLFFRRHYPVSSVIFCALDPEDRKWIKDGPSCRVFGFVARKQGSATDNVCHLFAEHDPEQPASAIVNFVSKVMIGSPRRG
ncbi:tensin-3-like [Fukomys damarensis]|uniref:tensin-3-like n=1 Tax=Fukomys damarensis TaxID=885580 RepID=UPI00053FE7FB|nr:tensin-3-like [Fukomys damarensis]